MSRPVEHSSARTTEVMTVEDEAWLLLVPRQFICVHLRRGSIMASSSPLLPNWLGAHRFRYQWTLLKLSTRCGEQPGSLFIKRRFTGAAFSKPKSNWNEAIFCYTDLKWKSHVVSASKACLLVYLFIYSYTRMD